MSEKDSLINAEKFLNLGTSSVVTQRIRKAFRWNKSSLRKGEDEEDNLIHAVSKERINEAKLKEFLNNDKPNYETKEEIFESKNNDIIEDKTVNDKEFRQHCLDAMNKCRNHVYIFFLLEKSTLAIETFTSIFSIIADIFGLSFKTILCICVVLFSSIIFGSFGDWPRLREKYSHLYKCFEKLCNSKAPDRIKKFEEYSQTFGTDDLSIDSIFIIKDKHHDHITIPLKYVNIIYRPPAENHSQNSEQQIEIV